MGICDQDANKSIKENYMTGEDKTKEIAKATGLSIRKELTGSRRVFVKTLKEKKKNVELENIDK